jgi:hypothetical protein
MADEVMKRAKARIEAGWTQYQSSDQTQNNVCLTRAINEAADEVSAMLPEMPEYEVVTGSSQAHKFVGPDQVIAEVSTRVNQAIAELNPGTPIKGSMIAFNDAAASKTEVLAVLDRALALK